MKSAPFDYMRPDTLDEALAMLSEGGDEAMLIAGGQTLVPMMAMRFARPTTLIDINRLTELKGIDDLGDAVRIGGGTRQCDCMTSSVIGDRVPLLAKALPLIGHQQTRNRGTVGGSVAHGDPAAEIPLIVVALDAEISLQSLRDKRAVNGSDFYDGPMSSIRVDDECLIEIRFPVWAGDSRTGTGFEEVSERHGDFAVVAAAVQLELDDAQICKRAAIAIGGASGVPARIAEGEAALVGNAINNDTILEVLGCIDAAIDPADDSHATAAYRRRVARKLVERAITTAAIEAGATL